MKPLHKLLFIAVAAVMIAIELNVCSATLICENHNCEQ